jgi:soluble lytic murein transglycosylase-like protein
MTRAVRALGGLSLIMLLAVPASAQVHLAIGQDGKKTIYNIPSRSSGGGAGGDLTWLARQRNRRSAYDAIILRHCSRAGVDPVLAKAVIQVESAYDPNCISNKGARGLMQLMPDTAHRFRVSRIFDPEDNIRGGVEYLAFLLETFSNDLPTALAAYNAGENAVIRYGGIPPYDETTSYVRRALTVYYGKPYGGQSVFFAKGSRGPKLKGGFRSASQTPLSFLSAAVAAPGVIPSLRYLGTR